MKVVLTILASLFLSQGFSQSFSVGTTDTSFTGLAIQYDFGGYIDLLNHSGSDIELKLKRVQNDIPDLWETSICDPSSCKPPESDSSNFILPTSGLSNHINIHFYPNGEEGIGTTIIRVEEINNSSLFYTLSFTGDTRPLSSNESPVSFVSLYPNPTNDLLMVNCSESDDISINIHDLSGRLIISETGKGNSRIDLSSIPKGVYLVTINSKNISFSEKIVRQ